MPIGSLLSEGWVSITASSQTGGTVVAVSTSYRDSGFVQYPFWLDPTDPHRLRAAQQVAEEPHIYRLFPGLDFAQESRLERSGPFWGFSEAFTASSSTASNLTPGQAADELIARIKQILKE
jgi:hypothetical protein